MTANEEQDRGYVTDDGRTVPHYTEEARQMFRDERDRVQAFVDEHWFGAYSTVLDREHENGRLYRTSLHVPDGRPVFTLVRADGSLIDLTRANGSSPVRFGGAR